ncbi:MAG TPA: sigma-70 family RNA polymerase sigma factor [Bacteroidota bacterium]|nr:sigma-70 family RNA polymerase sigma factor [Bacteroidota bacterium]
MDASILGRLLSGGAESKEAWEEFLRSYSNLFLKVIWQFEKNHDAVMETYLHVCSRFADRNFAILRRFRKHHGENPPKFSTWLAAVVRNMCVDEFRKEHGRRRYPKALLALSEIDRKVFALYYWHGYSISEIDTQLQSRRNGLQESAADSLARIESSLLRLPAERSSSDPRTVRFDENTFIGEPEGFPPEAMERWLSVLSTEERLVVRLTFWEEVPPSEIARTAGIAPESRLSDLLRSALRKLRNSYERQILK